MDLILYYKNVVVGEIKNVFESDGVWHGAFETAQANDQSEIGKRVTEYLCFCQTWNEAARVGNADATEFKLFEDIIRDGVWFAQSSENKQKMVIKDAPVFFVGGEMSFRLA